ncbi:MAG: VanW family protein [Actinomadura sp.]
MPKQLKHRSSKASAPSDPQDWNGAGGAHAAPRSAARHSGPAGRRTVLPVVVSVAAPILLVLSAYLIWAAVKAGELRPGTRVAGVEVGGLAPAAAEARLRQGLAGEAARPVTVVAAGRRFSVRPATAGLTFDAKATVAAADHGFPSPVDFAGALTGREPDLAPRVSADGRRLAATVASIAKQVDRPRREATVRYSGLRPVAFAPKSGKVIDQPAAARAIQAAYLGPNRPLTLEPRPDIPTTTAAAARRVAATTARTAVAAPLTLTQGDRKAVLPPQTIARNLRFVADGRGGLRPQFGADTAVKGVEKRLIAAADAPRDASFEIVKGRPRLVPARTGQGVDTTALARAVPPVLVAGGDRTVAVEVTTTPPRVTTEQARGYRIREKISSFTTQHPCCAPRVTNIHRISEIVDGHIVKPGETFSLNGLVGRRDKARGFVEAPMILNGRYVDDVGGGVSQFATTMFNAVFFGGLQDVQHTPHEFYISRYPAGRESTVSFPQPDFRWRNDSPYGVLIKTSYTDTSVTVTFWSTKRYDITTSASDPYNVRGFKTLRESGEKCIDMPGAKGFTIDVYRVFEQNGREVRRQRFHSVYQPEPKLTCEEKTAS